MRRPALTITMLWFTFTASGLSAEIGTRVVPPSQRGYTVEAIRESGERGGMLLSVGDNFTPRHNKVMGDAMELWNAHRWDEAAAAFRGIWRKSPQSPWAAEAELHEACYHKFNARYDEAEERFVSLLEKYPDDVHVRIKVLKYLPDVYARTGRIQAAYDALNNLRELPLNWQERQFLENYRRIYARAAGKDDSDRLCGTKALALALAAQNDRGESLRNVSLRQVFDRHAWALEAAKDPRGYSLGEMAGLCGGRPVEISAARLRELVAPGRPVLVHFETPPEPKAFELLSRPKRPTERPLSGHFVVVESMEGGVVDVLDPDAGRVRLLQDHFLARWSGAVLELPGQGAFGGAPISASRADALRGGCCGIPPPDPTDECGAGGNGPGTSGGGEASFGGGGGLMDHAHGGGCVGCSGGGGSGSDGGECGCEGGRGSPVYSFGLASANLSLNDTPMWYPPALGPDMKISLTYNRVATQRAADYTNVNFYVFGEKWHFRYAGYAIEDPSDDTVQFKLPGGRMEQFVTGDEGATWTAVDIWNDNTMVETGDWYALTFDASKMTWYFNTDTNDQQRLEKIVDRYGNEVTFEYNDTSGRLTNMTDAVDREFSFSYGSNGYVTNITDSLGREALFEYSAGGDLVSLTDMGELTTTIAYDANHWPTNITYPSGESWSIGYEQGEWEYPDDPFRITVEDPLQQTNEYFYTGSGSVNGMPVTVEDKAGNTWLVAYKDIEDGYSEKSVRRYYYRAVNTVTNAVPDIEEEYRISGDQWTRLGFDVDGNRTMVATTNGPYRTHIGAMDGEGYWTADVLATNSYSDAGDLTSHTVLTNVDLTYAYGYTLFNSADVVGVWTNWYDDDSNLLGTRNPLSQETGFSYDSEDRLTSITNALDQVVRFSYDVYGQMTNRIDALNRTNTWAHNTWGLPVRHTPPLGAATSNAYDAIGRLEFVKKIGPRGRTRTYVRDDLDRVTAEVDSYGFTNAYQYGCCGVERFTDRLGNQTFYDHDELGRVERVTDPLERVTEFGYSGADQVTNLTTYVNGNARVKTFEHASTNGFSRLTKVTTPLGKTTDYDYTFRGQLSSRVDGMTRTNAFIYDVFGRLTNVTFEGDGVLTNAYDVLGQATNTASDYSEFTYQLDALNRATQTVCAISGIPGFSNVQYTIEREFDAVGNVTNRIITGTEGFSDTIATRYAFDALDRMTNVVQMTNQSQVASATYDYHNQGWLERKTYGNSDVVYQDLDKENRLQSLVISNGSSQVRAYGYLWNAGNQILAITNDSAVTGYGYDAAGQLTNEVTSSTTNTWDYDEAGNWLNADTNAMWTYNADNEIVGKVDLDEYTNITVTGEVEPGPSSNKWYDSSAECREVSAQVDSDDGSFSLADVPVYAGHNELVVEVTDVSGNTALRTRNVTNDSISMAETFLHDGNGNLTNRVIGSENWVYEWDWADRLVKVSSNNVALLQNWYDAKSRRIAKQEIVGGSTNKWVYIYDGWDIVAVMDGTGALQETFTRGVGLAGDIGTLVAVTHHEGASAGTYYIQGNHRGDVVMVRSGTSTSGTYSYSAFGQLSAQTGTDLCRFKFSSKEREASCGLSYYGYRFVSPKLGRWLSRDPIHEPAFLLLVAGASSSQSRQDAEAAADYSFVVNDPISQLDPLGLKTLADCYCDLNRCKGQAVGILKECMGTAGISTGGGLATCTLGCLKWAKTPSTYGTCWFACMGAVAIADIVTFGICIGPVWDFGKGCEDVFNLCAATATPY